MRPTADKILQMQSVTKRINDEILQQPFNLDDDDSITLLNTIKIPKNLQLLTDRLPKPTYYIPKGGKRNLTEPSDKFIDRRFKLPDVHGRIVESKPQSRGE